MEWKAPASAAMSTHTFETGDEPKALPPRCRCGFQLDGIVQGSSALADLTWQSR
jgi:hypothetical protein